MRMIMAVLLLVASVFTTVQAGETHSAALHYQQFCQSCHGVKRVGGTGPALLPESLARFKRDTIRDIIAQGRPATQMIGYTDVLSRTELDSLVDYLYTPSASAPTWTDSDILTSHTTFVDGTTLPDTPQHGADPLNLFVVVESGNHHVNIMDGDHFEILARFPSHHALHGGPKFSPDGRFVYFASRDGWISKYDLHNLTMVSEIRAGLNTRNMAVSDDGRWALVGNYLPAGLVLLDANDLSLVRTIPSTGLDHTSSRVSAVYTAPSRNSFIVALKDTPEVWELSYAQGQAPTHIRRIAVNDLLDDFSFTPDHRYLVASSRKAGGGQVIDLDTGLAITDIELPGMPHLGSGIYWQRDGRWVFATPNISQGLVTVLDMDSWEKIDEITTLGPGFFMRSHEHSPYAWTDVFFGPDNDAIHVIDKHTLDITHTLRPMPGKNAAHVEFTHDGRHLVLSVWDTDGALLIYDASTIQEIKRIPMNKPSGKYNVGNKINFAEGTSH